MRPQNTEAQTLLDKVHFSPQPIIGGQKPTPEAESILAFRKANDEMQIHPFLLSCKLLKRNIVHFCHLNTD